MTRRILVPAGLAAALAVSLAGCDRAGGHHEDEAGDAAGGAAGAAAADAVRQAEAATLAAFKAKDAARAASYYAEDAVVMIPGRAVATGRAAVEKAIGEDLGDPNFTFDFTNAKTDVAASGDMAYTRGSFRVTYTDPKTRAKASEAGSYVTVFRKGSDGAWRAVADISTPSIPIPPPAPAG